MLSRYLFPTIIVAVISVQASDFFSYSVNNNEDRQSLRQKRDVDDDWTPTIPFMFEVDDEENEENSTVTSSLKYYEQRIKNVSNDEFAVYFKDLTSWLKDSNVTGNSKHEHLKEAYRKAASFSLRFDFTFYGHQLSNITLATGGFIYVGDPTHTWLAATQYIAPLMANFDTKSENSTIRFGDDGTKFIVEWTNVRLRDNFNAGEFTFQTTLHKNGSIWFVYDQIPIPVSNISRMHHPMKTGISDAYIFDHKINDFEKKRVIHEYHRIEVPYQYVQSKTIVLFDPLPMCQQFNSCSSCNVAKLENFNCTWCADGEGNGFCSDDQGLHRRRQQWYESTCSRKEGFCEKNITAAASTASPLTTQVSTTKPTSTPRIQVVTVSKAKAQSTLIEKVEHSSSPLKTLLFLIMVFSICFAAWFYYAMTNPYSASGQFLIKYRPSQWRSPANHVRYSATLHM